MKPFQVILSFSLVFLSTFFLSCSGSLDLEPTHSISDHVALDSDSNVKAVLIGAYDQMVNVLDGWALSSEMLAVDEELLFVGYYLHVWQEIVMKNISTDNAVVSTYWSASYQAINTANNVLSALEVVDEKDRASVEGEALFIRSWLYFELVRFFAPPFDPLQSNDAKRIPLLLEPTRQITIPEPASVQEVYGQILADLIQAEKDLLPAENGFFATKWAAAALLSRVYLQMGNYEKAEEYASLVIDSGRFSLLDNFENNFNKNGNSAEDIFAIQISEQDGYTVLFWHFSASYTFCGGGGGTLQVQDSHLDLYEPGDARGAFFCMGSNNMTVWTRKWEERYADVPAIRLGEMYVTRAECNYRLENAELALADYNETRTRAGLDPAMEITLEEILKERRREIAFEGFGIHDVKRLKGSVVGFAYDTCALLYPIPESELSLNPNLIQHTCY